MVSKKLRTFVSESRVLKCIIECVVQKYIRFYRRKFSNLLFVLILEPNHTKNVVSMKKLYFIKLLIHAVG